MKIRISSPLGFHFGSNARVTHRLVKVADTLFRCARCGLSLFPLLAALLSLAACASQSQRDPVLLRRGQKLTIPVAACHKSMDTGLRVQAGQTYRFATEANALWRDWITDRRPDGTGDALWYPRYMRPWSRLLRVPGETPFALYGQAGKGPAFFVGTGGNVTMPANGSLHLFVNDVRGFYWNNTGSVSVSISLPRKQKRKDP